MRRNQRLLRDWQSVVAMHEAADYIERGGLRNEPDRSIRRQHANATWVGRVERIVGAGVVANAMRAAVAWGIRQAVGGTREVVDGITDGREVERTLIVSVATAGGSAFRTPANDEAVLCARAIVLLGVANREDEVRVLAHHPNVAGSVGQSGQRVGAASDDRTA